MRNPLVPAGGLGGFDGEMFDAGAGRALREGALDPGHRLDLALDVRFDAAVRPIADEAGHAFTDGGVLRRSSGSRRPGRGR